MRTIFISAFLFFSLGTIAQQYLLKNENVIFSFDTQSGKHVVLAKDKDNAYLVYRYGTTDSIEFEYPEKNKDSWGAKTTRKGSMTDLRDSDMVERDTDLIEVDEIKP